jgi:hypothetical protein
LGAGLAVAQAAVRAWWGEPGWVGLCVMGAGFAAVGAVVVVGADRLLGGDSPARAMIDKFLASGKVLALRRRMGLALGRAP